ncbi:hypothetical protein CYMTET_15637 [Cymbomonas tetramitiformis]|uniref:Tyrosine-protein kinase ephrin type A/B receptor-like domain-containing protein n=1 Tax=Cymbomonas tetramitiformis TaxID=36881 RepID=A0AAE0GDY7_9CHLO|nr:hypothetical protein CYMTET_15637 [Cymbomonas tetramitiformis]
MHLRVYEVISDTVSIKHDSAIGLVGIKVLEACDPGYYLGGVELPESTDLTANCRPCPPGTFMATKNSLTSCEPCQAGHFTSSSGSTGCAKCGVGTFAPLNGSISCESCPTNTNNYLAPSIENYSEEGTTERFVPERAEDCLPMVGFYGARGKPATSCPAGGVCCQCDTSKLSVKSNVTTEWIALVDAMDTDLPDTLREMLDSLENDEAFCTCVSGTEWPFPDNGCEDDYYMANGECVKCVESAAVIVYSFIATATVITVVAYAMYQAQNKLRYNSLTNPTMLERIHI